MPTLSTDHPGTLEIEWNACTVDEWDDLLDRVPKSNLLQSWPYAQAVRHTQQLMSRFGLIRIDGETAGFFQVQEVKLLGLFHTISLDRGPLWLRQPVPHWCWTAFLEFLNAEFPRRIGRQRRIILEAEPNEALKTALRDFGFRYKSPGYKSIWLDLRPPTDDLRKALKQKWRNGLNRAERSPLDVEIDLTGRHLSWLLARYDADRRKRKFRGPPVRLLKSLFYYCVSRKDALLVTANLKGEPTAGILMFEHGRAATYQIAWTSDAGRAHGAHQLLLWHAILALKEQGSEWLDVGGIDPEHAEGLTRFKRGLGGEEFELVGFYA